MARILYDYMFLIKIYKVHHHTQMFSKIILQIFHKVFSLAVSQYFNAILKNVFNWPWNRPTKWFSKSSDLTPMDRNTNLRTKIKYWVRVEYKISQSSTRHN